MSLYHELKRRNVIRVAIAYLALAWLVTEVAGTLFPAFGIPDWGIRFLVIVFALGFVPALIISWAYEITPEGLKREQEVVRDASISHLTAKRLDWITIGLMVAVLAFIVADRFWMSPRHPEQSAVPVEVVTDHEPTSEPEATESQYPPNSIAVLPFANRSANPDDAYFVDGIHDDLLTHISKIGAIKTISRTSVMQYRGSSKPIPEIAAELGVATVLEGGVQRAGDQIRINVQLIDASTDEHLWAEIYDRQLLATNIFAIQSEIAEAHSGGTLQTTLSPREQQRNRLVPTESFAAYEAYLVGKQRLAPAHPPRPGRGRRVLPEGCGTGSTICVGLGWPSGRLYAFRSGLADYPNVNPLRKRRPPWTWRWNWIGTWAKPTLPSGY